MRAIFIKEVRENVGWAGLILLATAGVLIFGLYNDFGMGMSILGRTFLTLCTLVYPAVGLALGLLQVFQDSRKGRWQFVTHRPMSVTQFLLAKWAAGILLYLLATGIPLVLVTGWVAAPGHVPGPFTWDMTEPVVAHLLSGLMWYAGGFLVAGRSARWIGSRIIPIGGALGGAFAYNLFALTLLEAIGIIFIITAVILVAVWGVFVGGGETSNSPRWTRPAMGLTLVIGWLFVVGSCMGLGETLIREIWPIRQGPYRMYQITRDGQVEIWSYGNGAPMKVEDLSGHVLHREMSNRMELAATTLYLPDDENGGGMNMRWRRTFLRPESHVTWMYPNGGGSNWFYLSGSRTIVAYNQQTHWYAGSIGPDGFVQSNLPAKPFPQAMSEQSVYMTHSTILTSSQSVYQLDLGNDVRKIFSTAESDPVVAVGSMTVEANSSVDNPVFYVVATKSSLHILQDAKSMLRVPISAAQMGHTITVGRTRSNQFIIGYGMSAAIGYEAASYSVYGLDGTLVSHVDLPGKPLEREYRRDGRLEEYSALTLTPPGFFATVFALRMHGEGFPREVAIILVLAAIGWMGVMFWRLRAGHVSGMQMWVWLLLAACLGLTGVLVAMSMLKSVAAVRCLKCGKRRLVSESRCENCAAEAEGPRMEGIEIFAVG